MFKVKGPRGQTRILISALNKALDLERPRLSRRRFIWGSAALGVTMALPKILRAKTREIGILGAGLAGLTAAYQLSRAGYKVKVIEAQTRVGGRVWTQENFNDDQMFVELGGELVDTGHLALKDLAQNLGLKLQSLEETDRRYSDIYFFQGKSYRESDLIPLFQPLAKRITRDQKKAPTLWDGVSLRDYLERLKPYGEAWVLEMLQTAYVNEYGLEAEEQSALNFLSMIGTDTHEGFKLFGESDECWRIEGGNGQIGLRLAERLKGSQNSVLLGHSVARVSETSTGRLEVEAFENSTSKKFIFDQVICALPLSVLRESKVFQSLPLTEQKKRAIHELGYGTNSKLMLGFRERTWRRDDLRSNGSIYTSLKSQQFWETSRGQRGVSGILTNFTGGKHGANVSAAVIPQALEDLERIHPGLSGGFQKKTAFFNWSRFQWSQGSYSCTKVGQVLGLLPALQTPELKGKLIFAGEHTSKDFGGFMNGAIEEGSRAAQRVMGLKKL